MANLTALKGLAPVNALANTLEGKAALTRNLGVTGGIQSRDYREAFQVARKEIREILGMACGSTIADCARNDESRLKDAAAVEAMHNATQTYGLPAANQPIGEALVDISKVAPEAGHPLTAAFPAVTLDEANAILAEALGPAGGFLDDESSFGVSSRLNLYAATGRAAAAAAEK